MLREATLLPETEINLICEYLHINPGWSCTSSGALSMTSGEKKDTKLC